MENKFKQGEKVFERINPSKQLIVTGYTNGMYYCRDLENKKRKPFVYFERDLKAICTTENTA